MSNGAEIPTRVGNLSTAYAVRTKILASHPSIYDPPADALGEEFYTANELELLLKDRLVGSDDLAGLPIKTRSKVAKELLCEALGYDTPASFPRISPRFPHLNADLYVQVASNLQLWNQDVDASRRYVILIVKGDWVVDVHVIAGADLALLDRTGTLTSKFQASRIDEFAGSRLVSAEDTQDFISALRPSREIPEGVSPVVLPEPGEVLDIGSVYDALFPMVGLHFDDPGMLQDRNRGSVVHREACKRLGLSRFADNGQFPDVLSQLLEVKLQLARTIDLGLELPESSSLVASTNNLLAVKDVRYAIFYAKRLETAFQITSLVVVTGADFFREFRQFGGLVSNSKLQLRLPARWFN